MKIAKHLELYANNVCIVVYESSFILHKSQNAE